ncbi:MAG: transposase [Bacteroidetes bacterium]|nr:transposase [Bacteroidota bacterium]
MERFNKSYREGVLDSYLFDRIEEVREVTEEWVFDYTFKATRCPKGMPHGLSRKMKNEWSCSASASLRSTTPIRDYKN